MVTHSTELGHFKNDPMLTKRTQATICDSYIAFLFCFSIQLNKISSAQISLYSEKTKHMRIKTAKSQHHQAERRYLKTVLTVHAAKRASTNLVLE